MGIEIPGVYILGVDILGVAVFRIYIIALPKITVYLKCIKYLMFVHYTSNYFLVTKSIAIMQVLNNNMIYVLQFNVNLKAEKNAKMHVMQNHCDS